MSGQNLMVFGLKSSNLKQKSSKNNNNFSKLSSGMYKASSNLNNVNINPKSTNAAATNSITLSTDSTLENKNPKLVGNLYSIKEKLGSGSFGEVRLAINVKNKTQVAIKFEHKSDLKKHLNTENQVYQLLNDIGFPKIYWFGKHGDYTALVMDRLGPSLKVLYSKCNRIFPVQTVCLIAIQLLERLESLHNVGWLHQDIKPENIVVGVKENSNILYLIDYGTSSSYIDSNTKKHRIRGPSSKIVGTARYSSLNNHYGYKQSRRDDLESLGYTLIYWLLGRLPWQGIPEKDFRIKWKKVRRIKRALTPDELCRGLPVQFRIYMKYIYKLSYAQRPNYGYLRGLFRQLCSENDEKNVFAWEKFGLLRDNR